MDVLHKHVTTVVEEAEHTKSNVIETFFLIKAMALAVAGKDLKVDEAVQAYGAPRVLPHLTESWFC